MARKKVLWLGNKHKKEFHRMVAGEMHPAACKMSKINKDHLVVAKTAKELRRLGYDAAKHCNQFFRSRENT